jgi:hypothetical protein
MRSSSNIGSSTASTADARPRPSATLIAQLRQGKDDLRRHREGLSLREKVRQVLELQRLEYPLLIGQRPLQPWKRPRDIEPQPPERLLREDWRGSEPCAATASTLSSPPRPN